MSKDILVGNDFLINGTSASQRYGWIQWEQAKKLFLFPQILVLIILI